jgi:hypothetical protein
VFGFKFAKTARMTCKKIVKIAEFHADFKYIEKVLKNGMERSLGECS